ncbi:MAG: hypothetical protein CR988_06425 [Treponema sp.]|nr:MAG: hypothetical protein CR988_06425 [Treponema sp.]
MNLDQLKKDIIKAHLDIDRSNKNLYLSLNRLLNSDKLKKFFNSKNGGGCIFSSCSESCAKGCSISSALS